MSRAGHTTGPWIVERSSDFQLQVVALDGWRTRVCEVPRHTPLDERTAADARLIAAAPLMLEALENLENDDGLRMPDSAWELVQKAVEVATGRRKPSAAELRAGGTNHA